MRRSPIEPEPDARRWPTSGARSWLAERSGGRRLHAGVDLGHAGALVVAPEGGVVYLVGRASYGDETPRRSAPAGWAGYGPELVLLHGDSGWWHLLAHVERVRVAAGASVDAGAPLGIVSRRSQHLHWEVRAQPRPERDVATVEIVSDPAAWLEDRSRFWGPQDGCPSVPVNDTLTPRACRPERLLTSPEHPEPPRPPEAPRPTSTPREVVFRERRNRIPVPPRRARRHGDGGFGWLLAIGLVLYALED